MQIDKKECETYFTSPVVLTKEQKDEIREKFSVYVKYMKYNRIRLSGHTEDARLRVIDQYFKQETPNSKVELHNSSDDEDITCIKPPEKVLIPKEPVKYDRTKYRCTNGCSCTPLTFNSPPPNK